MADARKHHKVPQSLLRQFAVPDRSEQIYVYDKKGGRSFVSSIGDAGAARDFYAVGTGTSRISWEPAFQLLDDRLAVVLRELSSCASLAEVDEAARRDIPVLVATQLLRTQLQRTTAADVIMQLNAIGEPLGVEPIELSDIEARLLHLQRLLGITELTAAFRTKDTVLLQSTDAKSALWISDNPVTLHNTFPYGRVGAAAPGIEMYLPISEMRCLALYCPSIGEQIRESLDPKHPRPRLSEPIYRDLLQGIDQGSPVPIAANFISFLNELQIRQSSRFLYSAGSDFTLAERVLRAHPSMGEITSLLKLGELGAAPPPSEDMPAGTFLLLEHGHSHHVLSVMDRSATRGTQGIVVQILDAIKWRTIDSTVVFDSATLIVDGQEMRQMREVVITAEVNEGEQFFVIKHADPGLQALMESIR